MAKVSLRIYNRDIETLTDQGSLEEAVAHCLHILKTYPKHLETYRLLGKAYLESRSYDAAADIFARVLVSVPDDFVSHVGMSIIRDDQGKLDEAIWHMERAHESQPSNPAVQGELQRLYGRRDGTPPTKIRMTRGALAHMYVQGELYTQAIGEIRAVLKEDPGRWDMQVLLARAYFRAGQRVEASEICTNLLKKFPYCLDANRILVEILPGTGQAESTQTYRHRVNALDPYAAFVTGSVFESPTVADAAVSLDRLEWRPGQSAALGPGWANTMGIRLEGGEAGREEQPDWLRAAAESEPAGPALIAEDQPGASAGEGEEIPEFLRQAGWNPSDGDTPESPSPFDAEDQPAAVAGDLPDWIRQMAPRESAEEPAAAAAAAAAASDAPDWLQSLGADEPVPSRQPAPEPGPVDVPEEELPDWMKGEQEQAQEQPAAPAAADAAAAPAEEVPDWLRSLGADAQPAADAEEQPVAEPAADLPDWLGSLGAEPAADQPVEPVAAPPAGLGDELDEEVEPSGPGPGMGPSIGDLGKTAEDQDAAMLWLESLAAKQGARAEELITDPNARSEDAPDWVAQARQVAEEAPAEEPAAQGQAGDTSIFLRNLEESETAGEGAPAEDLSDWLGGLDAKPDRAEETPAEPAPGGDPSAPLPEWLKDLEGADGEPAPGVTGQLGDADLPEWLQGEGPAAAAPVSPDEWQPADEQPSAAAEPAVEQEKPAPAAPAPKAPERKPPARKPASKPAASQTDEETLEQARKLMSSAEIPEALELYGSLIKRGRLLEEIIRDLRDVLYRYPVEVPIWQALGDAYMRGNQLQEALDAYTKAEELLR